MEEQNNQTKEVKKITLGLILGWGLGVLAAISGVTLLFSEPLTGILMLVLSVVLLPPANKFVADKFNFSISGGLKFILVVVLLGIIGATVSTGSVSDVNSNSDSDTANNGSENTSVPTEEEAIVVSAVQLSREYDDNKVAADAKYEDKIVEVSGIVNDIGKDILDDPYVTLEGISTSLFGIQCMFPRGDESQLASLSKGQSITLQGRVSGELVGNVILRGCSIVN